MCEKLCINCAYCSPTTYDHKVGDWQVCCTHIAFFRTGIAKPDENGEPSDWQIRNQRSRPPISVVNGLFKKGYLWVDTLAFRQFDRYCCQYSHPLYYLKECIKRGFIKESDLDDKLPLFKKVLKLGKRAFERTYYPKVVDIGLQEGYGLEPKPEYTQYEMCSTCKYIKWVLNEEGSPTPFKALCTVASSDEGLFSIFDTDSKDKPTLSFLSCERYCPNPLFRSNKGRIEISPKLVKYVETNPFQPSIEYLEQAFRLNQSWVKVKFTRQEYEKLMSVDQDENMLRMFNNNLHNKFDEDNNLGVVKKFFVSQVKRYGLKQDNFYRKFEHLKD